MSLYKHVFSTQTYVPLLDFVFPNKFCDFFDNKLGNILENVVFIE
jgi:predicted AAA+ superfamily ATPase